MNIDFDKTIEKELQKDIEIPNIVLEKTNRAFEDIRNSKDEGGNKGQTIRKPLIASIATICLFSLIAFSKPTLAAIRWFFRDVGIRKAVDNGYVQPIIDNVVKDNGVSIKIDDVMVDKTKAAISFTLNFDDATVLKNADKLNLDMVVTDETGRTIMEDGNAESLVGGLDSETYMSNKDNGEIKYTLTLYSPEGKMIDINSLKLNVKSINLYNQLIDRYYKKINGNWSYSIKLDSKFKNTETIKYIAESKNETIDIVSAEMLPTGLFVKFIVNTPVDESIINKVTIVDEKGNTFQSSSIANMSYTSDRKDLISMTFSITSFDNADRLQMVVKDINGEDIKLNLVKVAENK
ncbi:DUF4179 domain-containing protein [Clostridium sp. MSJ-11]|uniref:DUF4179 domain-containing protein n=1 Tax=Clostridium mobile TaxID=2841512 RepID=A0ABS6EGU2_9CLOT|nr:DUF4179 domain-containing protein [Clostridium mobile]MBU5484428.1 DUF4179 domain-containing protein [Clostridium mobile]